MKNDNKSGIGNTFDEISTSVEDRRIFRGNIRDTTAAFVLDQKPIAMNIESRLSDTNKPQISQTSKHLESQKIASNLSSSERDDAPGRQSLTEDWLWLLLSAAAAAASLTLVLPTNGDEHQRIGKSAKQQHDHTNNDGYYNTQTLAGMIPMVTLLQSTFVLVARYSTSSFLLMQMKKTTSTSQSSLHSSSHTRSKVRTNSGQNQYSSPSGLMMSIVMVPTLMYSIIYARSVSEMTRTTTTTTITTTSPTSIPSQANTISNMTGSFILISFLAPIIISTWIEPFPGLTTFTVILYGIILAYSAEMVEDRLLPIFTKDTIGLLLYLVVGVTILFVVRAIKISQWSSSSTISRSLTYGEQRVLLMIIVVVISQWISIFGGIGDSSFAMPDYHNSEPPNSPTTLSDVAFFPPLHVIVALTGSVGCGICCFITSIPLIYQHTSWPVRLGMNILGPISLINYVLLRLSSQSDELLLVVSQPNVHPFQNYDILSKPLLWLWSFLSEPEIIDGTGSSTCNIENLVVSWSHCPRLWGLIYWVIVLVMVSGPTVYIQHLRNSEASATSKKKEMTSNLSRQRPSNGSHQSSEEEDSSRVSVFKNPKHVADGSKDTDEDISSTSKGAKSKISVTVARKWFHLVAVLLFVPTTLYMPQLMSLSYAIALCVLMVIETVRKDIPLIQDFYVAFLDNEAKNEMSVSTNDTIIMSHIFLIVGCAAPHWLSSMVYPIDDHKEEEFASLPLRRLLSLFGILSIGVGDAMGAVVGKSIGRHKWGRNQRTVEGSLAMFLSMIVLGIFILGCNPYVDDYARSCWMPGRNDFLALVTAATYTTVMEAFTVQLDNLVLPLSGSTILLLFLGYMSPDSCFSKY